MNLDAICQIIEDAGLGTLGESLFQHHMPETATQGLVLRLPLEGVPINHYIPGFRRGSFQVIVRDDRFAEGQAVAERVFDLLTLHRRDFQDAQGKLYFRILQCLPRTEPIVYPRMGSNLTEWSINFDVAYLNL